MDFGDLIRAVGDVKLAHVLQTMTLDPDLKSAIWEVLSGGDAYLLNERKLRKDFPMTCKVLRK